MHTPIRLLLRRFFLREERSIIAGNRFIRRRLRRRPFVFAIIGGTGVVLFWRGVWHIADITPVLENPFVSLITGIGILFVSGLLVFQLIGQEALNERLDDLLQREQELKREELNLAKEEDLLAKHEAELAKQEAVLAKQERLLRVAVESEDRRRRERVGR